MNLDACLSFLNRTPTVYQAVAVTEAVLREHGFCESGRNVIRSFGDCLLAAKLPETVDPETVSFRVCAAHGDSPCWKVKPNGVVGGPVSRIGVEPYGGMILSDWPDRPLRLAGRVTVQTEDGIETKLVDSVRPVALIPSCPPHLKKDNQLDILPDLVPLCGFSDFNALVADLTAVSADRILGTDLFLVCAQEAVAWGEGDCYYSSPRIDDLVCAYGLLEGFLHAEAPKDTIDVFVLFNHEEVGSSSDSGAAGALLKGFAEEWFDCTAQFNAALRRSFFVSADNAHGLHPNRPNLFDSENAPKLNEGLVIKYNAAHRYLSDGKTGGMFAAICRRAGVPYQIYANRSDLRGGSTLGSISQTVLPIPGVDIGLAQWAMHAPIETAGSRDLDALEKAVCAFFSMPFSITENGLRWGEDA